MTDTELRQTNDRLRSIARENIPESNLVMAKTLLIFAPVCLAFFLLFQLNILNARGELVTASLLVLPAVFVAVSVLCLLKKGHGAAFQYVFFFLLTVFWSVLELMSGCKSKLLLAVLVVMSLRYYNRRFTVFVYAAASASLLLSVCCSANFYRQIGLLDLNTAAFSEAVEVRIVGSPIDELIALDPPPALLLKNGLLLSFLPNFVFLTAITLIAMRFMRFNLSKMAKAEELAVREADQRLALIDLRTKNMLSQVKPHFVYNTLTSIAQLCTEEPARAKRLSIDFANYLRGHLDTLHEEVLTPVPFSTELANIRSYLNIELVRFEDTLRVEYDIQADDFMLPSLSVQPIVENAVKHGVCKRADGGTVKIAARKDTDGWRITVTDDGVGFDPQHIGGDGRTHIGIESIRKRIALFGGSFTVESTPGVGTTATVLLPQQDGAED